MHNQYVRLQLYVLGLVLLA